MSITKATFNRVQRTTSILAPISTLASGFADVQLLGGRRITEFSVPINQARGLIRATRGIDAAQARTPTAILTLRYNGDADTRAQTLRLRAALRSPKLFVAPAHDKPDRSAGRGRCDHPAREGRRARAAGVGQPRRRVDQRPRAAGDGSQRALGRAVGTACPTSSARRSSAMSRPRLPRSTCSTPAAGPAAARRACALWPGGSPGSICRSGWWRARALGLYDELAVADLVRGWAPRTASARSTRSSPPTCSCTRGSGGAAHGGRPRAATRRGARLLDRARRRRAGCFALEPSGRFSHEPVLRGAGRGRGRVRGARIHRAVLPRRGRRAGRQHARLPAVSSEALHSTVKTYRIR